MLRVGAKDPSSYADWTLAGALSVAAGNYEGAERVKVFGIFDGAVCSRCCYERADHRAWKGGLGTFAR